MICHFKCLGVNRFYKDVEMMLGFPIGIIIKISWAALAPMFNLVCIELEIYYIGGTCFGVMTSILPTTLRMAKW